MAEQHGADRPDDYKRFSSLDKDYDFQQQSLASDTKTNQTDTETQTHHKETDTTILQGNILTQQIMRGIRNWKKD